MRLSSLTVLPPPASLAAADYMEIFHGCNYDGECGTEGEWHSGYGIYWVDPPDGCSKPDVPGMTSLCLHMAKDTGYFLFENQSRRCLHASNVGGPYCNNAACYRVRWDEVECPDWVPANTGEPAAARGVP